MSYSFLKQAILPALILIGAGFCLADSPHRKNRTVSDYRALVSKPLPLGIDVVLEGTVTFVNQKKRFILADETSATAVSDATAISNVKTGDVIRIVGSTALDGNGRTRLDWQRIERIGQAPLPAPIEATARKLSLGLLNYHRIHATGVIADAFKDEVDETEHILLLRTGSETLVVALPDKDITERDLAPLVGARVSVTGICMPLAGIRRFLQPYLEISCIQDIAVLSPPPVSMDAVPELELVDQLSQEQISSLGQRRVTGLALASWNECETLVRTDDNRLIRATLAHGAVHPRANDRIIVIGFPEADNFNVNLKGCTCSTTAATGDSEVTGEDTSGRALMTGRSGRLEINTRLYGHLVRIKGTVTALPSTNDRSRRIGLASDGFTIPIDINSITEPLPELSPGCQLEITGVCVIQPSVWDSNTPIQRLNEIFIVPRTSRDVVIVSRPPWLTVQRLLIVISSLLALIVGIFIRNRILNRLVERRGRALMREEIAHARADLKVEERTRLAVELHDTLSQNITGVALQLEAAQTAAEKDPASVLPYLEKTRQKMQNCRDNLRNCLWDLRSRAFEEDKLGDAIRKTIAHHLGTARADIACDILCRRLSDNTVHAVLCVIRELVVNAIRHGKASRIDITGRESGGRLFFSIRDNGCGFDPATRPGTAEGHFGLQGIDERIRRLDGSWHIDSAPGHGCSVTIRDLDTYD